MDRCKLEQVWACVLACTRCLSYGWGLGDHQQLLAFSHKPPPSPLQVSAGRNYTKICKAITSGFFFHT